MIRIISLVFFLFLLISCSNKREGEQKTGLLSHFISLTDNEDAGVKEILSFYGGQCEYAVGMSASTKDGSKKYFELEMSKSSLIEEQMNNIHLPSSNIAFILFNNLKEEKVSYDEIHVVLISKDNSKQEFKFPISVLEKVKERMSLVDNVVRLLKQKKYAELSSIINNETSSLDKETFIARLKEIEPQFGTITASRFFGFKVSQHKGKKTLHLSGALIRDKQSNEFSIDVDFNSDKEEIYKLEYKF